MRIDWYKGDGAGLPDYAVVLAGGGGLTPNVCPHVWHAELMRLADLYRDVRAEAQALEFLRAAKLMEHPE